MSLDWMDQALCAGLLDFTERDEDEQRIFCRTCPVAFQCRNYGVTAVPIPFGDTSPGPIYGGLNNKERASLRRHGARKARVPDKSVPPRGTCPECNRSTRISSSGAFYTHDDRRVGGRTCSGSGMAPEDVAA